MSYGREIVLDNLSGGLADHIGEADLPAQNALTEKNFSLDLIGAIRKRLGISRFIPQAFGTEVKAIIPISDCFGVRDYIIGSDTELRVAKK